MTRNKGTARPPRPRGLSDYVESTVNAKLNRYYGLFFMLAMMFGVRIKGAELSPEHVETAEPPPRARRHTDMR